MSTETVEKIYVKLKSKNSSHMFRDSSTINNDQVREMDKTPEIENKITNRLLVEATEAEYTAYQQKSSKTQDRINERKKTEAAKAKQILANSLMDGSVTEDQAAKQAKADADQKAKADSDKEAKEAAETKLNETKAKLGAAISAKVVNKTNAGLFYKTVSIGKTMGEAASTISEDTLNAIVADTEAANK